MAAEQIVRSHQSIAIKREAVLGARKAKGHYAVIVEAFRRALGYVLLALLVASVGVPTWWMISAAFKTLPEIYRFPPTWIPLEPTLRNFPDAWNAAPFGRFFLNSIVTTAFGSGFEIYFAVTSAYALAFLHFPKKKWVFLLLLVALMIPPQVTILPNYILVGWLKWVNTYQGIVVPGIAIAYGTFLLRQQFLTLEKEVIEAAKIDGAGTVQLMTYVVLPMSRPAIVTMALLSITAKWNDFLWPLIVTNRENMRTLPIGLYWLHDQEGNTEWGLVMAATIFVLAPIVLLFVRWQRHIVEGIAAGAVKG